MATKENPAAVELGRRGGRKKVPKGFAKMPKVRRAELGRAGAVARWGNGPGKKT